ncbi:MAG: lactonase family protein, partial [Planctomycetales bacterium]|nr:lactonase family protein [Planctomycetales bacterium]
MKWSLIALACLFASSLLGVSTSHGEDGVWWTYIGTYTRRSSEGIYVTRFDANSGKFGEVALAAATADPSFLAIHPSGQRLYAVGETAEFENQATGFVRGFNIDAATGKLSPLNSQRSEGVAPCHLTLDKTGRTVLVANYGSGTVASIRIDEDGNLGDVISTHQHSGTSANARRQEGPHAHSINLDAANQFAFAADLGVDKIFAYRFDAASGRLDSADAPAPIQVAAGSGPRHFAFHPSGKFAYVINELASTLIAFSYNAEAGVLHALETHSTLLVGYTTPS